MLPHCFASLDLLPHVNLEVRATIHYTDDGSPPSSTALPASSQLICKDLNLTSVVPVNPSPLPGTPSELIYLRANFEIGEYQLSRGFINDTSFRPSHTSNILHSLLSGRKSPPHDSSGMIITKNAQTVVDIVIDNFDDGSHPFHLHGYRVWVLGYGDGYFSYQHPEIMASLNRPERVVKRDTVTIEPYHWVAVRVMLDNPGVWMLHCHTAWHLEAGMAAVMVVDGLKVASWKGSESKPAEDGCGADARQKWPGVMDEMWTSKQWGKS